MVMRLVVGFAMLTHAVLGGIAHAQMQSLVGVEQRQARSAETVRRIGSPGVNFAAACTPGAGVSISADFDYSMPPRYTRESATGFPLLRNTASYVTNRDQCACQTIFCIGDPARFQVILDSRVTISSPPPPHTPDTFASPTGAHSATPGLPTAPIPSMSNEEEVQSMKMRQTRQAWRFEGGGASRPIEFPASSDGTTLVCLPEGKYSAELRVVHPDGCSSVVKDVRVVDHLVVVLGDSFASGEGNPELRLLPSVDIGRETVSNGIVLADILGDELLRSLNVKERERDRYQPIWARTGERLSAHTTYERKTSTDAEATRLLGLRNPPRLLGGLALTAMRPAPLKVYQDAPRFYEAQDDQQKTHDRTHRSAFAASSQAALDLEDADQKSSVTFVNLAMSGATVAEGILGPYVGARGARYRIGRDDETALHPQLEAVASIVKADRRIDHLIVSIGGNDVGFANLAEVLVAKDCGLSAGACAPSFDAIREYGIERGRWAKFAEFAISGAAALKLGELRDTVGLNGLSAELGRFKSALNRMSLGTVHVMGYPDLTRRANPDGELKDCKLLDHKDLLYVFDDALEISPGEARFARNEFLVKVNQQISDWVTATAGTMPPPNYRLRFVDVQRVSERNGVCAPPPYNVRIWNGYTPTLPVTLKPDIRWFRGAYESLYIQGGDDWTKTTGVLHPNEYGHRAMANVLLESVRAAVAESAP